MNLPGIGDLRAGLRRHPVRTGLAVALLCALPAIALVGAGDDERESPAPAELRPAAPVAASASGSPLDLLNGLIARVEAEAAAEAAAAAPEPRPEGERGDRHLIAHVREGAQVSLFASPGGAQLGELGDVTEFGSQRNLWVKRVDGDWYGVPAPELPNGRLGWIRADPSEIELFETRYSIRADVSERVLELRYGPRVLERIPVTVGAPGSPTPLGDYSVTDGLAGRDVGPYYGCCILALSGHQPNLPANWLGGDRIAIHGTPYEIGLAASAGCLRASDRDMVSLFARVPLGTPVFIRS